MIKKFLLAVMAVAGFCVVLTACSKDDDKLIDNSDLPVAAKTFVSTYYPSASIRSTYKDGDKYDVTLSNNHEIEFNRVGDWLEVDAPRGEVIPSGFYPSAIDLYIAENTSLGSGINEITKLNKGYEVTTTNGAELVFNSDGTFLRFDR